MKIGQAARLSRVTAKMIRYYESVGLLAAAARATNSYRDFDMTDVHELVFIRRARGLGFSTEEISRLLGLWRDKARASQDVRAIATHHIADLRQRIGEMQAMVDSLEHLAHACHGDGRPSCPILDDLSQSSTHEPAMAAPHAG
jgi:MerR family transcriptional regulator, copper efflux regulator